MIYLEQDSVYHQYMRGLPVINIVIIIIIIILLFKHGLGESSFSGVSLLTGFQVCNYKGKQQEDLLPQSVHNTFQHVHLRLRRSITQTNISLQSI